MSRYSFIICIGVAVTLMTVLLWCGTSSISRAIGALLLGLIGITAIFTGVMLRMGRVYDSMKRTRIYIRR